MVVCKINIIENIKYANVTKMIKNENKILPNIHACQIHSSKFDIAHKSDHFSTSKKYHEKFHKKIHKKSFKFSKF